MLKLFEVSQFKNFEYQLRLDFSDVRDYRFNESCIRQNLLKNIIVYGKNASGKSNLGLAMFDIVSHLTSNNVPHDLYDYFLNVNDLTGIADFHYVFSFDSGEVDYHYWKNTYQQLAYESVSIDGKLLFEFDYYSQQGDLSGLSALLPTLNLSLRDNGSILRYAIANSSLDDRHPLYQMLRFVSHMLWFRSLDNDCYIGRRASSSDYFDFILKDNAKDELEAFLHQAGITENLTIRKDTDGKKRLYFDTHNPLPFFKVASSGTKALYTFFYWIKTASNASFMFIDEFDAFYHYELAEVLVKMLEQLPNTQVVLTSHNTNLLSNRIMRPDCYFILSGNRLTSFANATQRELREGHNLEKLYMSGEFNG